MDTMRIQQQQNVQKPHIEQESHYEKPSFYHRKMHFTILHVIRDIMKCTLKGDSNKMDFFFLD